MTKVIVIIKPGFLEHTDSVLEAFAGIGYSAVRRKRTVLTQEQCDVVWGDLKAISARRNNSDYYNRYRTYIMSGETECILLQSENDDYRQVGLLKYNLRKQYGVMKGFQDLLHTSDSNEDAEKETECIFN